MSTPKTQATIPEALKIAFEHHKANRIPQAKSIYEQILAVEPNHPHALHLLGLIFIQSGQHQRAAELIERAIGVRGDVPDFHTNLGEAWRVLGNFEQAVACHRRAAELEPANPFIRVNLASACMDAGREEEAKAEYEVAYQLSADNAQELEKLVIKLERTNQTLGARLIVDRGLTRYPDDYWLHLFDAKLDRRDGRAEQAVAKLGAMLANPEAERLMGADLRFEIGRACDRNGEVDRAFEMFASANAIRDAKAQARGLRKEGVVQFMRQVADTITPEWVASWAPAPEQFERAAPVFLVGFPRSGTTLLEQITGSHSAIRTAEEKPFMEMLQTMVAKSRGYPGGVASLGPGDVHAYRKAYFDVADAVAGSSPETLLLDKFPLNLNKVPLIQRVFPDARFILVLRHPADSILSCFMQDFEANNAMVNFHTLEGGAAMYDAAMSIWKRSVELLPINYHVVKYENLVQDFETEVRQLLEFMGLPWEDSVKEYQKTARKRERINTPSYSQVSEPIYQRSRDRWRRYEKYLAPIQPVIAPWLEYFDYPA